ncbi:hypothetical protein LEM8419_01363 [Neolewinella maritima]|uniref:GP-PDE domain-containing protein n=1 Tax=Neolewinella maritima TaxID=1383882 RepID=A0ABM9AZE2_9BACT|nr:glycerophosphodiester phosphodiesterase family protein [Neolewinella maritima]CAH1000215.1 hypothetical protein LEM8419_01363 [Neolewinella maritima]
MPLTTAPAFDWQGHRGARGLLPENTIPAFLRALSYVEVTTLELDVVISADRRVIVSHDPWMEPGICQSPSGDSITAEVRLIELTAAEIARYDCGQLPHARFPEQLSRPAHKPTLAAVFAAVDRYCVQQNRPSPRYNIELKYQADWEPALVPSREVFVDLVLDDVAAWGHPELVTLQCFDPSTLAVIHARDSSLQLAYLDEAPGGIAKKMSQIGFVPAIYSPWEVKLTPAIIAEAKAVGMRVIPWTVNDVARMRELRSQGVDGIITDYPNRIAEAVDTP